MPEIDFIINKHIFAQGQPPNAEQNGFLLKIHLELPEGFNAYSKKAKKETLLQRPCPTKDLYLQDLPIKKEEKKNKRNNTQQYAE